jgi:hypothetical protein
MARRRFNGWFCLAHAGFLELCRTRTQPAHVQDLVRHRTIDLEAALKQTELIPKNIELFRVVILHVGAELRSTGDES